MDNRDRDSAGGSALALRAAGDSAGHRVQAARGLEAGRRGLGLGLASWAGGMDEGDSSERWGQPCAGYGRSCRTQSCGQGGSSRLQARIAPCPAAPVYLSPLSHSPLSPSPAALGPAGSSVPAQRGQPGTSGRGLRPARWRPKGKAAKPGRAATAAAARAKHRARREAVTPSRFGTSCARSTAGPWRPWRS